MSTPLTMLAQISHQLLEAQTHLDLLRTAIQGIPRLLGAERASVFLVEGWPARTEAWKEKKVLAWMTSEDSDDEITLDFGRGIVGHVLKSGKTHHARDVKTDPYFFPEVDRATGFKTKNILAVPLANRRGAIVGVLEILNQSLDAETDESVVVAELFAKLILSALESRYDRETLQSKDNQWNSVQRQALRPESRTHLSSSHPGLSEIYRSLERYARAGISTLIEGESGTGKEVIARLIHSKSDRAGKPFVALNCAAIPEALFESELFGVVEGAATQVAERAGLVELADGGTLFLDEIGELPLGLQVKLLRVLQDKTVTRVGASVAKKIDFRLITATNRNLATQVGKGSFREDLYYRINVLRFELPPLRARTGDIPELCEKMMGEFAKEQGLPRKVIAKDAIARLKSYTWPGNIRQLRNVLENAFVMNQETSEVRAEHLLLPQPASASAPGGAGPGPGLLLDERSREFKRQVVREALERTSGNRTRAAKLLGISREGLRKILR